MRAQPIAFGVVLTIACVALGCGGPNGRRGEPGPQASPSEQAARDAEVAINATCPRSGKAVVADSTTEYRGVVVGFCNPHCRDDFAAHVADRPADRAIFDDLIVRLEVGDGPD